MKKRGSWRSTKDQCGSGNQRQRRIVRQKWEGLREDDSQEKIWWRWQWWQVEPRGRKELSKPILKMEESKKWGEQQGMRMAQELTAKDVEKHPLDAKRKNSPKYRRMKSTATELENAWWNTQRHLFSLPKPWMFHQSIQEFTWAQKVCR